MSKIYFVTGGAGFIGFHFCKYLLERKKVVYSIDNLDNYYDTKIKKQRIQILNKFTNFTFGRIDITKQNRLNKFLSSIKKIDYFVHLAAQAGVRYSLINRKKYLDTNVVGFFNIIEIIKKRKDIKHFLFASSSSVYGENKKKYHQKKIILITQFNFMLLQKKVMKFFHLLTQSYTKFHRLD